MSKDSSPNLVMPVAARREDYPKSQAHTSLSEADVLQGHLGQLLHLLANDAKSDLVAHQPPLSPLLITRLPDLGVTPDTVTCHSLLMRLLGRAHVVSQYNRHRVSFKPTIREGRVRQEGGKLGRQVLPGHRRARRLTACDSHAYFLTRGLELDCRPGLINFGAGSGSYRRASLPK